MIYLEWRKRLWGRKTIQQEEEEEEEGGRRCQMFILINKGSDVLNTVKH